MDRKVVPEGRLTLCGLLVMNSAMRVGVLVVTVLRSVRVMCVWKCLKVVYCVTVIID